MENGGGLDGAEAAPGLTGGCHDNAITMVRQRATAIVVRGGRVLLVRDRRLKSPRRYSLPGGGLTEQDEGSSRAAAIRELKEETGLAAGEAEFLFHHQTSHNNHSVYLMGNVRGRVKLLRSELDHHIYWDGKSEIDLLYSARTILKGFGFLAACE